jgi:general secretion pathway protein A
MYAAFFGLSQPPFSIAPDPRYLFMSERHREALAHLLYGVESGGGFVLLTGEIGAGKTTVCRRFLEQTPEHTRVAYIFNPKLTVSDLLQTICHEFGVSVDHKGSGPATIKAYLDPLNAHLLQCHAAGEHSVLIIDEAQSLSPHVLEQLRLLTNLETNERKLLQIILIGQPELRQMLARPEMEQLAQRVIARFHLGALSEAETLQYVAHRMGVAGWRGSAPPFTADALRRVHGLSGGVPRRINLLCDRALLGAYAGASSQVGASIVQNAAREAFGEYAPSATRTHRGRPAMGWMGVALGVFAGAAVTGGAAMLWHSPPLAVAASERPGPEQAASSEAPDNAALALAAENRLVTSPGDAGPTPSSTQGDVRSGLPPSETWFSNRNQAFSALGPLWGPDLGTQQPCSEAQQLGLQCYRTPRMTVNGLRQLNRPAVLKLFQPGQQAGYVLVTAIVGETIELSAGEQRWRMPLSALSGVWKGDYASLWRTPPGQKGRLSTGFQQPAATWMAQQLTRLQSQGKLPASAKSLKDMVEAFQRANGIEADGVAGPGTLMFINRASGVDEPRLLAVKP